MDEFKKLGGQSPPVTSETSGRISGTILQGCQPTFGCQPQGDVKDQLGQLDHWPESVAALEGVLRDFYIGL